MANNTNNGANLSLESKSWRMADGLRANMDAAEVEDDGEPFDQEMKRLTAELAEQMKVGEKLDKAIWKNLREVAYAKETP